MFNVTLQGDRALIAALEEMPGAVRAMLEHEVSVLAIELRQHIVADKLSGQVLNRISGDLSRSIMFESPIVEGEMVAAEVYSTGDVKYAAVHEYGLTVHKVSSAGKAFTVHYPERSFLRSAFHDHIEQIKRGLQDAVARGLRVPLGAPE